MIIGSSILYDLTTEQVIFLRKAYRTLRIRMAAYPPNAKVPAGHFKDGMAYGMSRDEAKAFILAFASELNWYEYLGTK